MPKYPFAWSPKRSNTVKPEEVAEMILRERVKPDLKCPDKQCRTEHPSSKIIPVCCDPRDPCADMPPYFRMGPKHKHRYECPYEEVAEQTEYVVDHKKQYEEYSPDANLLRTIKGIQDTSLLPDAYIAQYDPAAEYREIQHEADRLAKSGYSRKEAVRIARCRVPQRTGSLSLVVAMRERLEIYGEPDKIPLSLPNRPTTTYAKAFFSIAQLREHYRTPYILHGEAKIFEVDSGYVVAYKSTLTKYVSNYKEVCAFTFIDRDHNETPLQRDMKHYAESNEICCVYSFSTHRLNERTCPDSDLNLCVVIEPITSDEVVIRKRCVKWSSKRSV